MKVLTDNKYYGQIADVIREQNGTSNTYTPSQMVRALKNLFYEEVEGAPPITFQGIGENLLDYRIYGASGGVGDKTNNLFDGIFLHRSVIGNEVGKDGVNRRSIAIDISNYNNGEKITFSRETAVGSVFQMYQISSIQTGGKLCNESVVSGNSNTLLATITITKVNEYPYLMIFLNGENNPIEDEDLIASKIMINVGSTALPYEPYGYKVPVVISGKNLFDEANAVVTEYYMTSGGQEVVGANGDRFLKSYINVKPSTEYTFKWSQTIMGSSNNTPYIRISEYTSNNTFIQRVLCQCSAQSQNNYTFTTSNNTSYIDIRIDSETSTRGQYLTEVMLVKGATAPDTYEEYTATTTNIYLDEPIDAKANIPSEYTEVEYIESTGTQYINTNIIPTDTTGVEAKITICNDNNWDNVFIGCRETGTGENRYWIDVDWTGTDTIIFGFNGNTPTNDRYFLKGSDVGKSFIISMNYMNDRTGKINGITYDTTISSKTLVSMSKPMYIFAGNRSGYAAYQYSGKLYNLKITDGTNVIRNFVPCYRKSDNVAGLYDLVNSTFYTNQGTGNFIVGPIKENESISLSDTNVNIPTIRGTNVLTVDTTVQPSNVYVKARKESQYEAAMREEYEQELSNIESALEEV